MCRHDEQLVTDPFDVTNSMAHFELLNARARALLPEGNPLIDPVRAYWSALRGMMRIEMEEVRVRFRVRVRVRVSVSVSVSVRVRVRAYHPPCTRVHPPGAAGSASGRGRSHCSAGARRRYRTSRTGAQ